MLPGSIIFLFYGIFLGFVSSQQFLTLLPDQVPRVSLPPCTQPDVSSCTLALVNVTVLTTQSHISIPVSGEGGGEVHLALYTRDDKSAVFMDGLATAAYFAWTHATLSGQVLVEGRSWSLEGCGPGCYVWVEQDQGEWGEEECESGDTDEHIRDTKQLNEMKELGKADTTTIVTYTVMIWYTEEFKQLFSSTEDIEAFTDLVILETNQAYISGNIPVRVSKHCVQHHPTLTEDVTDSSTVLSKFRNSMSTSELRNSADAAALLVADLSGCGIAYTHTTGSCFTLSVTKKSCATGYYSFGHELGHNFGMKHNPEKYETSDLSSHPYLYGHGYLIQPTGPSKYTGYRTILAYRADGHSTRINRYSDPGEVCSNCLESTSVLGDNVLSNNAQVLIGNRFAMAACGDEQNVCSAPPQSTTAPPTTAPPCTPKYLKNKTVLGKKIKMNKMKTKNIGDCWKKCFANEKCSYVTWVAKAKKKKLRKICTFFSSLNKIKKKKGTMVGMCK